MFVPEKLLIFAKELRKEQTDAELLLWSLLRGRRFCGFKFRRQYPVNGYILDFYCHEVALVIELDGGGHNLGEQRRYDDERTKNLAAGGLSVIRFWNNDVLNSTEDVLQVIYEQLLGRR
jgi:very-short-patch-repair endonuclease